MPVVVTCPNCQRKARVPRSAVGKTIRCRGCGTSLPVIPADAAPPEADAVDVPAAPEDDARRVTRAGVGLLAASEVTLAVGTALELFAALAHLLTADPATYKSAAGAWIDVAAVVGAVAQVVAIVVMLVGTAFCAVAAATVTLRAWAGAALALALLALVYYGNVFGGVIPALMRDWAISDLRDRARTVSATYVLMALTPVAVGVGLQVVLAMYGRCHARQSGDRAAAVLAGGVALLLPPLVLGPTVLAILVSLTTGQPHPTVDEVVSVLVLLAKTVLVALAGFVFLRVWLRLG